MKDKSSFEKLLRPLRRELNPELAAVLLRLRADDDIQARYEELADRNTEGRLTPQEQEELAALVRANLMLGVLKAEARAFLRPPSASPHTACSSRPGRSPRRNSSTGRRCTPSLSRRSWPR